MATDKIRSTAVRPDKAPVLLTPRRVLAIFAWGFGLGAAAGMALAAVLAAP